MGSGANTTVNASRYWLNLFVKDGKIVKYNYNLPKDTIKALQKAAKNK
jgi:hypothetical protein